MKAFEKIIGYENEKKELMRLADVLSNPNRYKEAGITQPRGLLIDGAPGLGKTLMANCLIEASGRTACIIRKDKPNGDFVNYIKETFEHALENAPSIILLDDMDKFANEDRKRPNTEEYVTVQSCIDNVKGKDVFVIATTNQKRNLPESLLRSGRFDKKMSLITPEYEDSLNIIKHFLSNKEMASDIDPEYIAKLMRYKSCAEIETMINEAAILAVSEGCEKIQPRHVTEVCMKYRFGTSFCLCKENIDLNDAKSSTAERVYHEAGHAVISEILHPESVVLVAVGKYSGKMACSDNTTSHDKHHKQKNIMVALSGLAAIDQKYGQRGFGGHFDTYEACNDAESLIKDDLQLGFEFLIDNQSPEDENQRFQIAVHVLLEMYYYKTKEILAQNREFLDRVASELAEKKLLTMYDIQRIKSQCRINEPVLW